MTANPHIHREPGFWYSKCRTCNTLYDRRQKTCPADLSTTIPYHHPEEQTVPPHTYTTVDLPLIFVMGVTNTGKSTIMETMRGYEHAGVGLIEVGKMMRAKYPPEYFKGSGAPQHTQAEAWGIMNDGIKAHVDAGRKVALIDGQPRNWEQMQWALSMPNPKSFIHLWAPPQTRLERAHKRDSTDVAKLKLTLDRLHDDVLKLYDIIAFLHLRGERVETIDTTSTHYAPFPAMKSIINHLVGERVL